MKKNYNYLKQCFCLLAPSCYENLNKHKVIVKYLISGSMGAVVDLGLLYIFTDIFKMYYLLSASLAFIVAFFVSFYLQKFWTFRDNSKRIYQQMSLYFIVGVLNLAINTGGMYILVDKLKIMYILAQILMGGLIAVSSFLIYRLVIFSAKGGSPSKDGQAAFGEKKQQKETAVYQNNKLKILMATGIFPPDIGGPATMLKALCCELLKFGCEVKVITYGKESKVESQKLKVKSNCYLKNFDLYIINRKHNIISKYFKYFWQMWKLAKWADIVYVTDTYSVGYFAYLMKKLLRKKYIVRFAGDSAWETAVSNNWTKDYIVDFQEKVYNSKIEKLKKRRKKILTNADKVIAVSNFISGIAKKIGVKEGKIKVIYNSIDFINKSSINDRAVREIKSKYGNVAKIIVTACRLTPWKGVDGIIKILPQLKEKVGNVNFLVLGEGQELDNLKYLANKLGVSKNVYFLGRIKHNEIMNYFKAADLFILNTNYEALSHTILEAMKAEVPIITTNIGGNPEVINNNKSGLLVRYNDNEELLKAAVKILTDQQLAEILSANAKNKLKQFSWNNTVEATVKLLKEVCYE